MQDPPSSHEASLPHQKSKRILGTLYPPGASIHNFQDTDDYIPPASPNPRNGRAIVGDHQSTADGPSASQSIERGTRDTLRDEKEGVDIPGEEHDGEYRDSSDTIGDEEKHNLGAQRHWPLGQNSSSTIGDVEKQERGTTQTNLADQVSIDSSRDLEKGESDSERDEKVKQDGENKRQGEWENDVVGWDGPNDPQKPHNWKKSKKYTVTALYSSMTLCITFASSVFSTATMVTAKEYGRSNEVMTLGTSLFVLVSPGTQHDSNPSIDKINRVLLLVQ